MSNYALVGTGQYRPLSGVLAAGAIATSMMNGYSYSTEDFTLPAGAAARYSATFYVALQQPDTASIGGEAVRDLAHPRFEAEIASFYERLLKVQQPLGQEFQEVLSANLWDLYAE